MSDVWPSLLFSLRIAIVATSLAAAIGVPLAYAMARRPFRGRALLEGLILMPMVLPPTVVGYAIIMAFGSRGWVGAWLGRCFDYSITFRFEGAVLAAAVVALPILYLPSRAAFAGVERDLEDAARLSGAGGVRLFVQISLPLARRGIVSGLLLGFARSVGEFGATLMVLGWQPGRVTLPISVYADYTRGELASATPAVAALSAISLALVMAYNASSAAKQD